MAAQQADLSGVQHLAMSAPQQRQQFRLRKRMRVRHRLVQFSFAHVPQFPKHLLMHPVKNGPEVRLAGVLGGVGIRHRFVPEEALVCLRDQSAATPDPLPKECSPAWVSGRLGSMNRHGGLAFQGALRAFGVSIGGRKRLPDSERLKAQVTGVKLVIAGHFFTCLRSQYQRITLEMNSSLGSGMGKIDSPASTTRAA